MSEAISVFIPCNIPTVTAQQKGCVVVDGRPRFFKKKQVEKSESTFHALFQPHRPKEPFDGPIVVGLWFCFPWRKSEKASIRKRFRQYPLVTRPDLSNLVKTVEDVMTTLRFWNDDNQISSLHIKKFYGDNPGIHLSIQCETADEKNGNQFVILNGGEIVSVFSME